MPGFVIVLLVLVIATVPIWPYSADWGYRPAGVLAVALVLMLLAWWFRVITPAGSWAGGTPSAHPIGGLTARLTTTTLE